MKNYITMVNGVKVCIVNARNETEALNKFERFVKNFTRREQLATFGASEDKDFEIILEEEPSDIILI
jgi:hypothetical protein